MHTKIFSATTIGIDTYPVEVEVDLSLGLLQFFIVGLADTAIKESRQRVQAALKNCGIRLPERKITVNLAPADLKKEGTQFDLPIALGILQAAGILCIEKKVLVETIFLGELSLDGSIKAVKGVLPIAFDAQKLGKTRLVVSQENAAEAALIKNVEVIGIKDLNELIAYLRHEKQIKPTAIDYATFSKIFADPLDFDQVKGQYAAKRALQIAAAGRHNILFIGSPGSGKTMLAKRLPSIMPMMSFTEVLQTSKIYSITGKLGNQPLVTQRPFRSPHHTISQAGLVGGGSFPQPGEISLAHNGILFLDELTEFKRDTLEVLRQPLEHHEVSIARAQHTVTYPACFLLVAALNPCPCGFLGDRKRSCSCSPQSIAKYIAKLSGPLLDRIDLQVAVPSLDYETLLQSTQTHNASSASLYTAIEKAVAIQRKRFGTENSWNAYMTPSAIDTFCMVSNEAADLVKKAFDKLFLTMRSYHKLLKIARTIADLEGSEIIQASHLKEALFYRLLDQHIQKNSLHG